MLRLLCVRARAARAVLFCRGRSGPSSSCASSSSAADPDDRPRAILACCVRGGARRLPAALHCLCMHACTTSAGLQKGRPETGDGCAQTGRGPACLLSCMSSISPPGWGRKGVRPVRKAAHLSIMHACRCASRGPEPVTCQSRRALSSIHAGRALRVPVRRRAGVNATALPHTCTSWDTE